MRVIFTPLAERQIDRLHEYITDRSSGNRADAYIGRILAFCGGLSTFPLRGQRRDDLLPGLRTTGFERRVTIAFVVTTEAVLIEGIFYAGQNFETTFRGQGGVEESSDTTHPTPLHVPVAAVADRRGAARAALSERGYSAALPQGHRQYCPPHV